MRRRIHIKTNRSPNNMFSCCKMSSECSSSNNNANNNTDEDEEVQIKVNIESGNVEVDEDNRPTAAVYAALEALLCEKFPKHKRRRYQLQNASAKGDNYLGVVYRIIVNLQDDHDDNFGAHFSLILKVPPQNMVRRKQFFARPCFLRESVAYEEFLPLAAHFQQEHDIPEAERFSQYAVCYRSLSDEFNEAIFLQDLCKSGFALYDRFSELKREHVAIVMRAYGKLHAISLALKQQQPARLHPFQQLVDIFKQRKDDVALGSYFEQLKVSALGALNSDAACDEIYVERLKAYFARGTTFELLLEQLDATNCEPYAVVCHGDCWNNNIMYRHEGNLVVDCRLIDWQLMRYASPITDLAYYFYTCTTKQFRDAHFSEMLNIYYAVLAQHLGSMNASAEELFPRTAFETQLKQKFATGLLLAMMVLPIITISGKDVPDLEALSERIEAGGTTDLEGAGFLGANNEQEYKRRMRGIIIDCVEHDYI